MARVVEVVPLEDYRILLTFFNGDIRIFDVKPYLSEKFWSSLLNLDLFMKVKVTGGSVEWNSDIDFCPDELYEKSFLVGRRLNAVGY